MGYKLNSNEINKFFESISDKYDIYAPKCFEHGGRFSDTDCIRYGKVKTIDEIVFDRKSDFHLKKFFYQSLRHYSFLVKNLPKNLIQELREPLSS